MVGYVKDGPLFASSRFSNRLEAILNEAVHRARSIDPDEILQRPPDRVANDLFEKYRFPKTSLNRNNITARMDETVVDVSGDFLRAVMDRSRPANVQAVRIDFQVPFEGPNVFNERASTFTTSSPHGRVENQHLIISRSIPLDVLEAQREAVVGELNREIDRVEEMLEWIQNDLEQWELRLKQSIETEVQKRRTDVLAMRDTEAMLGVPIDRDNGVAATYSVAALPKRKLSRAKPRPKYGAFEPEPGLSDLDFEYILSDIGRVLAMFERLPVVHVEASEEHLRDQIVVTLNGIYSAGSSETFSKKGKTDIYLPWEDNAVFIAECKWWRGETSFSSEALPQLLDRYIVWRDTHTAMVLFIKNMDVSAVIAKARDAVRKHPRYVSDSNPVEGFETFVLHQDGDEDRRLTLALLPAAIRP